MEEYGENERIPDERVRIVMQEIRERVYAAEDADEFLERVCAEHSERRKL